MTSRRYLIAGNWKMNKTSSQTRDYIESFLSMCNGSEGPEILIFPPFTNLELSARLLTNSNVAIGAQNFYFEDSGAYTGEVSAQMLLDCGCAYVLVGHSERRSIFSETDDQCRKKVRAALTAGLTPILCVGETAQERRSGDIEQKISTQLSVGLKQVGSHEVGNLVVAYEPLWAIGTGDTATPNDAQQVIHSIRMWIAGAYDRAASENVRILYGGSVKPQNTSNLINMPDIDGALVGGASLSAQDFAKIISQAEDTS